MTETTDQVLSYRRTLLLAFLIGWVAWYGFFVLMIAGPGDHLPRPAELIAALVGFAGWIVFAVSLYRIVTLRKRYKDDPGALAALNDEMARQQTARAMTAGLFAVMGAQVYLALVGEDFRWSSEVGAHFSIFVGVTAVFAARLWFDREEEAGGE